MRIDHGDHLREMSNSLNEICKHGTMVASFVILNWLFVLIHSTAMIPRWRVSYGPRHNFK